MYVIGLLGLFLISFFQGFALMVLKCSAFVSSMEPEVYWPPAAPAAYHPEIMSLSRAAWVIQCDVSASGGSTEELEQSGRVDSY